MKPTLPFGRIAGIRVGANWTVLVIVWLITWSLATTLPEVSPGWSPAAYWVLAAFTAATFFASLLAHELAHSIVAKHIGIDVDSITLWIFGGVSRLRSEARTPKDEMKVALAGPLTSIVIAGLFLGLAVALEWSFGGTPVTNAVAWLGGINAILALFNLAPALPLDGGRVVHAIMWKNSDATTATIRAARWGRIFAFGLMGIGGFLLVSAADYVGALWLIFIGWFIGAAGRMEALVAETRKGLGPATVADAMRGPLVTVPAGAPMDAVATIAVAHPDDDTFLVVDDLGEAAGAREPLRSVA